MPPSCDGHSDFATGFTPPFGLSPNPGSSLASKPSVGQFSVRTDYTNERDLLERYEDRSGGGGGGPQHAPSGEHNQHPQPEGNGSPPRDWRFWMVFISILLSTFIAALDLTAISTAAPVIVNELNGLEFTWIGSAYGLTSTAFLPWSGGLAVIFGRRAVLVTVIVIFAIGSALCGASQNMTMLIASRSVQGIGAGGILSLSEIVIADLVPLKERGIFLGYLGATWAMASALGPPIGGALSEHASWRWLFYMNVPLSAIALVFVLVFLKLRIPKETMKEKLKKMDWIGNGILIGGSTSTIIALTWGGVTYPWSSWKVIVPLVVGFVGMGFALWYEKNYVKEPTIPFELLSNRTSLSGFVCTFLHSILVASTVFYLPVFFQAVLGTGPTQSGIDLFPSVFTMAFAGIVAGATITIFQHYRYQNYIGWVMCVVGMGVMSLMDVSSPAREWAGFQILPAFGQGLLYAATQFPILAALPTHQTAHALSFFTFVRTFGQVWGVTIGSTVLQNQLGKTLPAAFLAEFPEGLEIIYAVIPTIKTIEDPALRLAVKTAFAESLQLLWRVCIPVAGLGFLASLLMKEIPLHAKVDAEFGYNPDRDLKPTSSGPNDQHDGTETEYEGSPYVHHQHKFAPGHKSANAWAPSMDSSHTHPYGLRYDDGRMESAYPMVEAHQTAEEEEERRDGAQWGSGIGMGRPSRGREVTNETEYSTVVNSPNTEGGEWEKKEEYDITEQKRRS